MIARTRQYMSDLCCACMSIHVIVIPPPTPQKKIIYEGNCQVLIHMQIGMAILKYKNCVLTVFLLMMSIIKAPYDINWNAGPQRSLSRERGVLLVLCETYPWTMSCEISVVQQCALLQAEEVTISLPESVSAVLHV